MDKPSIANTVAHASGCACHACAPVAATVSHASGCACHACASVLPSTTITGMRELVSRVDASKGVTV